MVIAVEINQALLYPYLIFNKEFKYSDTITLYPVKMKNVIEFQQWQVALTLRKDSIFQEKNFIKMEYFDFLKFTFGNFELAQRYELPALPLYFNFFIQLLRLVCGNNADVQLDESTFEVTINGGLITNDIFEDLRKIILLQNDIDYNVDEFINADTVNALEKARAFEAKKKKEKYDIEDYIDSLIIELSVSEEYVSNLTIRKFWRYINRINKHEEYQSCRSAQISGTIKFKEPISHWMTSIEKTDKYADVKTDEKELRRKVE